MKRVCAYCGTSRFGLIRRVGLYVRNLVVVELHFCTKKHKQLYEEEAAKRARDAPILSWLHQPRPKSH